MRLIEKLQRKFGRYAVPNLTLGLVLGQVMVYVVSRLSPQGEQLALNIQLVPSLVLQGEVWRLFTFVVNGPGRESMLLFVFFYFYMFYMMGTALEQTWGAFRYNLFLLIGYAATVGVSMVAAMFVPMNVPVSNMFLQGTVFLAFAYLFPNFTIMAFLIIPIKIKWLGMLLWLSYLMSFVNGPGLVRIMVAASVANFFVFFGRDIRMRLKAGQRRTADRTRKVKMAKKPRHCCTTCGVTNKSDPSMNFRYCSKCEGSLCYCEAHLGNHEHVVKDPSE